ncbi:MAG: flavin oxidoreductase [Microbacterium sp.]|jgi:flavin reductase (DIM6/NTAB) family NADH-FMN oxidoreductase RutF|uniref:flavin reductase family protein n=1 Tax=Microbacterium sp. TaxID=51671 RepID=UPI00261324D4|nr:flavin reductase family protein [Microbacterium sp.]MDF2559121.1 flavin oxidoreductase [Microbacterium sp.]
MSTASLAREATRAPEQIRTSSPLPAQDFAAAFRHHPGGVALITATGRDGHVALTATSVASVSADPPLFVFSASAASSAAATIRAADSVVLHLIGAEGVALARLGATSGIDRFADTDAWTTLVTGEPVFHGTRWLRARVINRIDAGAATVVLAEALQSNIAADAPLAHDEGLVYVNRAWHRIGEHSLIDA